MDIKLPNELYEYLIEEFDTLVKITKNNPVVLTYGGERWVFETREDLVKLISDMADEGKATVVNL